jgi:hypothetical protein
MAVYLPRRCYINDPNFDYPHLVSRVVFVDPLGSGIYLTHKWYQHAWSYDFNLQRSYFDPHIGNNHETRLLIIAACLLFLVLAGGLIVRGILGLLTKGKNQKGVELPNESREGGNDLPVGPARWLSTKSGMLWKGGRSADHSNPRLGS